MTNSTVSFACKYEAGEAPGIDAGLTYLVICVILGCMALSARRDRNKAKNNMERYEADGRFRFAGMAFFVVSIAGIPVFFVFPNICG